MGKKIVFNFGEQDFSGGFEALPEGEYLAVITSATFGPTSKGDKDRINFRFDIMEPVDVKGRVIFDGFTLEESTMWKLGMYLSAFNLKPKEEGFIFAIEEDDDGNRAYSGIQLGKPDESGKIPFTGFIMGDGEANPFRTVNVVGATIRLTLGQRENTWNEKTKMVNTVKALELVGELPASGSTIAEKGNTGARPKFM